MARGVGTKGCGCRFTCSIGWEEGKEISILGKDLWRLDLDRFCRGSYFPLFIKLLSQVEDYRLVIWIGDEFEIRLLIMVTGHIVRSV